MEAQITRPTQSGSHTLGYHITQGGPAARGCLQTDQITFHSLQAKTPDPLSEITLVAPTRRPNVLSGHLNPV